MCHVSHVTYPVSNVMCHVSHVRCNLFHFFLSYIFVKLVSGGFVINRATPSTFRKCSILVELVSGGSVINGATPSSLVQTRILLINSNILFLFYECKIVI